MLAGSGANLIATEVVSSGGVASGTIVSGLGALNVLAGGSAAGVTVRNDGVLNVFSGGRVTGGLVSAGIPTGGSAVIWAGGSATDLIVSGVEIVSSGGAVSGTVLFNYSFISAGGTATGTLISGVGPGDHSLQYDGSVGRQRVRLRHGLECDLVVGRWPCRAALCAARR